MIDDAGTMLREIVRITLGGDTFRVLFTKLFGTRPVVIGAAEVAQTLDASSIRPGTNEALFSPSIIDHHATGLARLQRPDHGSLKASRISPSPSSFSSCPVLLPSSNSQAPAAFK